VKYRLSFSTPSIKPPLFVVASSEMLAGATGLQGNSLEAIASKLNVEEDTVLEGAVNLVIPLCFHLILPSSCLH
jgi:hypothetical protein